MPITKGYVTVDGGQLHYHRTGQGAGVPIVYLHMTASSGKMFYAVMQALDHDGPQVALDTPGFGQSFDPAGMPSIPEYADWIHQAITALGFDRVHLVGHHTGGCLAVDLADRFPGLVETLTLMGPVCLTAEERSAFAKEFSEPIAPTADGAYLQTTWDYLVSLGADSDLDLHHRELVDTVRAYWGRYQIYTAVWEQDYWAQLARTKAPALILCGEEDILFPFFDRAFEARPDAERLVTKGTNFEPDQDTTTVVTALRKRIANPVSATA